MKPPKRLTENDLELLHLAYTRWSLARYDQPSGLKRAGDRCAAAGLLRCDRDETESYGKYVGTRQYTLWVYDPDYIALHAIPELLVQVRADMPFWGDPEPERVLSVSEPRRGHLRVVGQNGA